MMGEDIKVMGLRRHTSIHVTVACAIVSRYVRNIDEYVHSKTEIARTAQPGYRGSSYAKAQSDAMKQRSSTPLRTSISTRRPVAGRVLEVTATASRVAGARPPLVISATTLSIPAPGRVLHVLALAFGRCPRVGTVVAPPFSREREQAHCAAAVRSAVSCFRTPAPTRAPLRCAVHRGGVAT